MNNLVIQLSIFVSFGYTKAMEIQRKLTLNATERKNVHKDTTYIPGQKRH